MSFILVRCPMPRCGYTGVLSVFSEKMILPMCECCHRCRLKRVRMVTR